MITLVLSEVLHQAIERPLMRIGQSRVRAFQAATRKAPPAAPADSKTESEPA